MDVQQVQQLLEQQRQLFEQQMQQMQQQMQQTALAAQQSAQSAAQIQQQQSQLIGDLQQARSTQLPIPPTQSVIRAQIRSVVDPKILERVKDFSGKDEDFAEWFVKIKSLASLLNVGDEMQAAVDEADESTVEMTALPDDEVRDKARAVYHILLQACSGKAFTIVRQVQDANGFLVWRRLVNEYRPEVATRHNAMLMSLLTPTFDANEPFMAQLAKWELAIEDYKKASGKDFEDSMKVAVLTRWSPDNMRSSINAISARVDGDYRRIKTELQSLEIGNRNYGGSPGTSPSNYDHVPMEIGKIDANATCTNCGKKGHTAESCWSRNGEGKKGKKGKRKGKGKDNKDNKWGSGGGNDKFQGKCDYCGKEGHKASECRKKKFDADKKGKGGQVGSVEEPTPQNTQNTVKAISATDENRFVCGVTAHNSSDLKDEDDIVWIMLDSGSDEHCSPHNSVDKGTKRDKQTPSLKAVEGTGMKTSGCVIVAFDMDGIEQDLVRASSQFIACDSTKYVLSAGKMQVNSGAITHLEANNNYVQFRPGGPKIPVVMHNRSFYVKARLRPDVKHLAREHGTVAVTTQEGGSSSSSGPAPPAASSAEAGMRVEAARDELRAAHETLQEMQAAKQRQDDELMGRIIQPAGDRAADVDPVPAAPRLLAADAPVADLRTRLKELRAPIYGTKSELHARLIEFEAKEELRRREREWLETRQSQLAQGAVPPEITLPKVPEAPDAEKVRQHQAAGHLPPEPWCLQCLLGRSSSAPHTSIPPSRPVLPRFEMDLEKERSRATFGLPR